MAPGRVGNMLGKSGIARTTIDGSIGCFINAGGQPCPSESFIYVSQMPSTRRGSIRSNTVWLNCASAPNPYPLGGRK